MAKIKLRAGKDAVEQAQSSPDFGDPPKPGLYHLKLEAIESKENKDGKGQHLVCRWKPVGLGREGTKPDEALGAVWDRVSLSSDAAEWTRARLAIALGAKPNRTGNVQLDVELDSTKPGSPVGTVCLGRVARDEDLDGNYRPKLGTILPLEATSENGDEGGFEDDEDDEETTSAFDDEEEGGEEEDDLLTKADLEAMDNKELAALLPEFDLDPASLKVKVKGKISVEKTRVKMITAILDAQGADEEDEDSDEDPF